MTPAEGQLDQVNDGVLALTFSTLLSSQGADAHPPRASRPSVGGNPYNLPIRTLTVKPLGPGVSSDRRQTPLYATRNRAV